MGKLTLKFGDQILKEVALTDRPVTIGRALDSDIRIDNLAVSHHHARIFMDQGQLMIEDLNSANGVMLNSNPIKHSPLRSGDIIVVGKHAIVVDERHDVAIFDRSRKVSAPKLQETFVVGSARRGQAATLELDGAEPPQPARARVPSLVVIRGKTDQREYSLSLKLLVIGKSPMATIRIRGWFVPQVSAQINARKDGYYLAGATKRLPRLNGEPVQRATLLKDGDIIDLKGLRLEFVDRD
jgi:pSer/pThr/pTyr-binding forkhead associated (FHA) protein